MAVTRDTPNPNDIIAQTQPILLANNQGYVDSFAVDHVDYNAGGAGKHNQSTYPVLGSAPATLAGEGAVYTKNNTKITGTADLYYRYQNAGGNLTGFEFPLTVVKAFGKATRTGNLVVGSSFNVTTAAFNGSPDRWVITFSSAITANNAPDLAKVMIIALPEVGVFDPSVACMSAAMTIPTEATIIVNSSAVQGISFMVLAF